MTATVFNCPIVDCAWTHRDEGPEPLPTGATGDDVHAQAVLHGATVEHALRAHYETHDAEAWVRTVSALHQELATRGAPLLCLACYAELHAGQREHANPAALVVGGNGSCLDHVKVGPPQIPGRTPGGLILGGG